MKLTGRPVPTSALACSVPWGGSARVSAASTCPVSFRYTTVSLVMGSLSLATAGHDEVVGGARLLLQGRAGQVGTSADQSPGR